MAYMVNHFANSLGVQLDPLRLSQLLDGAKYVDHLNKWHAVNTEPLKLQIGSDNNDMDSIRSAIQWFIEHCELSNMNVPRHKLKADHAFRDATLPYASEICGAIQAAQLCSHFDAVTPEIWEFSALTKVR